MQKLMIWASRCGQSTPKVLAICATWPSLCGGRQQNKGIHNLCALSRSLILHQEQGVEHDRFSEGNGQNRLDQNLRGRAGITSHRFRSLHADQAHADGRAQAPPNQREGFRPILCQHGYRHMLFLSFFSPAPAIEHGQAGEIL